MRWSLCLRFPSTTTSTSLARSAITPSGDIPSRCGRIGQVPGSPDSVNEGRRLPLEGSATPARPSSAVPSPKQLKPADIVNRSADSNPSSGCRVGARSSSVDPRSRLRRRRQHRRRNSCSSVCCCSGGASHVNIHHTEHCEIHD